jgi:hypothetical protein
VNADKKISPITSGFVTRLRSRLARPEERGVLEVRRSDEG